MKKFIFILASLVTLVMVSCNKSSQQITLESETDSTQIYHEMDSLVQIYINDGQSFTNEIVQKNFIKNLREYVKQYKNKDLSIINELQFECIGVTAPTEKIKNENVIACFAYHNDKELQNFNMNWDKPKQYKIEIQIAAVMSPEEAKYLEVGAKYKLSGKVFNDNNIWAAGQIYPYIITYHSNPETISLGAITLVDVTVEKTL